MFKHFFLLLILSSLKGFSQQIPKVECNTLFVCIDSISYDLLFKNSFVKDTLFVCKEQSTKTSDDNYTGKYAIGQSATLEFFKPSAEDKLGNHFGDWGLEFKTTQLGQLDYFIQKANQQKLAFDTTTTFLKEDTVLPWYKTFQLKSSYKAHQLSVIEYQPSYLQLLGFTQEEIAAPMSYQQFNEKVSGGKKYPRQFNQIKAVTITVNKKESNFNNTFTRLTQYKPTNNSFTLVQNISTKEISFSLQQIEIELMTQQLPRTIAISKNITIKVLSKKAFIIFNYNPK